MATVAVLKSSNGLCYKHCRTHGGFQHKEQRFHTQNLPFSITAVMHATLQLFCYREKGFLAT